MIAIREGCEWEPASGLFLHQIGCVAMLRAVKAGAGGRFVLVTAGVQRFQLMSVDLSRLYPHAQVAMLHENIGDRAAAALMATAVEHAFASYLSANLGSAVTPLALPVLAGDPIELSYDVAELMVLGRSDRQTLLAEPDALSRLTAEYGLLTREITLARALGSSPAPDFRHSSPSPN